jgi:predicted nucleotidyltransferase
VPNISKYEELRDEFEKLFCRKVDLLTKIAIEKSKNPFRKNEILGTYHVIYASG